MEQLLLLVGDTSLYRIIKRSCSCEYESEYSSSTVHNNMYDIMIYATRPTAARSHSCFFVTLLTSNPTQSSSSAFFLLLMFFVESFRPNLTIRYHYAPFVKGRKQAISMIMTSGVICCLLLFLLVW